MCQIPSVFLHPSGGSRILFPCTVPQVRGVEFIRAVDSHPRQGTEIEFSGVLASFLTQIKPLLLLLLCLFLASLVNKPPPSLHTRATVILRFPKKIQALVIRLRVIWIFWIVGGFYSQVALQNRKAEGTVHTYAPLAGQLRC